MSREVTSIKIPGRLKIIITERNLDDPKKFWRRILYLNEDDWNEMEKFISSRWLNK